MSELSVCAAYYASDGSSWLQEGDELNNVDVLSNPYRIECTTADGTVLFDCELFADCIYQKPSEQFHQWASQTGEAYGLSFPSIDEAEDLARCVESIIDSLQHEAHNPEPSARSSSPEQHTTQHTGAMPAPHKFPITRRELLHGDEGWRVSESQLRLTYPARLRGGLQVGAVTELARESHVQEFESRYQDHAISDLWLAVNDVTSERASREGLQSLGANLLSMGIPLGVYLLDRENLSSSCRQMVLCKAVLARSLPIAEANLSSLREATGLPVGYQSYTITPSNAPANTEGVPTNMFEHLYLVPHPHLILMTHFVKFEVAATREVQDSVPRLVASPAMSLLATHPEVLSNEDRESIFAVCSPGMSPSRGGNSRDLGHVVDLSYQSMWDELNSLATTQQELEHNLGEFRGSVETFQTNSWKCVQVLQDDMVSYLAHSGQVLQLFRNRKFEMNRALSDIARFQELFMFTQSTCTPQELLCSWRHLNVLWDQLAQELESLQLQLPTNQSLMSLTERNKKMISLKRSISFKDKMIARLSQKLDERGILDAEDLQLVGTL